MDTQDFTHAEASEAFRAFAESVGPKAQVYVSIDSHTGPWLRKANPRPPLNAAFYSDGIGGRSNQARVDVNAHTYRELLAELQAGWAERAEGVSAELVRAIALQIICIAADEGQCSEAALALHFAPSDIRRLGDRACEEATRIGGNGPFSIVRAASEVEAA